jgi:hypothetical protein
VDPAALVGLGATIVVVAGIVGSAWGAFQRGRINVLEGQVVELRAAVSFEQEQRDRDRRQWEEQLAVTNAKVEVLESNYLGTLAERLHPMIVQAVREAVHVDGNGH